MENEFEWIAKFKDGSIITQFDSSRKEVLFKEVLDRASELKTLTLVFGGVVSVDLDNGHFNLNGIDVCFDGLSDRTDAKYRPIYFKRVKQRMSTNPLRNISTDIDYHIGYQITINGKNYQRILRINKYTKKMSFVEKNAMG